MQQYCGAPPPTLGLLWGLFSPNNDLFGLTTANKWEKLSQPSDSGQSINKMLSNAEGELSDVTSAETIPLTGL